MLHQQLMNDDSVKKLNNNVFPQKQKKQLLTAFSISHAIIHTKQSAAVAIAENQLF